MRRIASVEIARWRARGNWEGAVQGKTSGNLETEEWYQHMQFTHGQQIIQYVRTAAVVLAINKWKRTSSECYEYYGLWRGRGFELYSCTTEGLAVSDPKQKRMYVRKHARPQALDQTRTYMKPRWSRCRGNWTRLPAQYKGSEHATLTFTKRNHYSAKPLLQ